MPAGFHPVHNAYIIAALTVALAGFILSYVLIYKRRLLLGEIKQLQSLIVVGHLIAYTLILTAWKQDGVNDPLIRASLIIMAVMPALIFVSTVGKPVPSDAKPVEIGQSTQPVDAGKTEDGNKPPNFSEGIMRGIWGFVAIWIFYLFYSLLFATLAQALNTLFTGSLPPSS